MKLIDLTHTFTCDMPVYPGDPPAGLEPIATIAKDGFNDCCVRGGLHVGTHMDAPLHMIEGGAPLSDIPLRQFFGRGRLIDARGYKAVTADLLDGVELAKGDIVLVMTDWSKHFRLADYYENFPEIDLAFAERLVATGISIMGLDTPSPDKSPYPVHKILLSQNVLIIENLNGLEALADVGSFDVSAAPAKFHGDAAPVRVVAQVRE